MTKVEAIVKPLTLDEVKEALQAAGLLGVTVREAEGFGRQKGQTGFYRGAEHVVEFLPEVMVEVVLADDASGAPTRPFAWRRRPAAAARA